MKGYVMNKSNIWTHAMKRAVGPGAKIDLDELFEQYGVKHSLGEGEEFITWLRNVKLKDRDKWEIVVEDGIPEVPEVKDVSEKQEIKEKKSTLTVPPVAVDMTIEDIVDLSVRKAREALPRVTDLKLLKYAFQEANQLAGKDSLCKVIRKRITELKIAR